jgi:hypothetical protein
LVGDAVFCFSAFAFCFCFVFQEEDRAAIDMIKYSIKTRLRKVSHVGESKAAFSFHQSKASFMRTLGRLGSIVSRRNGGRVEFFAAGSNEHICEVFLPLLGDGWNERRHGPFGMAQSVSVVGMSNNNNQIVTQGVYSILSLKYFLCIFSSVLQLILVFLLLGLLPNSSDEEKSRADSLCQQHSLLFSNYDQTVHENIGNGGQMRSTIVRMTPGSFPWTIG